MEGIRLSRQLSANVEQTDYRKAQRITGEQPYQSEKEQS